MKVNVLLLVMSFCLASVSKAQTKEERNVKAAIIGFTSAADNQDVSALDGLLNENFRIVMNQLFGSSEIALVDKSTYLSKIEAKEWGGDKREVDIEDIKIVGNNASVTVSLKGLKSSMISLIQLVKNKNGDWQVINDLPAFL